MISLNWLHKSVDHKTLCLSFFTRPLLGIPQRFAGIFVFSTPLLGCTNNSRKKTRRSGFFIMAIND
ncbi:hypothetical protein CJP72_04535 [Citrobacter sp. NCU1]|nr:hypothetical protein [Citrobacter sp. NCU1]